MDFTLFVSVELRQGCCHAASNGTCAVKSPANGNIINLHSKDCSSDGVDLTPFVVDELARMWNISNASSASDSA